MSSSLLEAAFAHHVWATTRVIDACLDLSVEELETSVIGTRGPILETLRHLVLSDAFDLFTLTDDRAFFIDDEDLSLIEVRVIMERSGLGWAEYISRPLDPDEVVREVDPTDGDQRWAPVGFRLAVSWTTAPTIAVRYALRSRHSVSNRRRSMSPTSGSARARSSRRCPTRSPGRTPRSRPPLSLLHARRMRTDCRW